MKTVILLFAVLLSGCAGERFIVDSSLPLPRAWLHNPWLFAYKSVAIEYYLYTPDRVVAVIHTDRGSVLRDSGTWRWATGVSPGAVPEALVYISFHGNEEPYIFSRAAGAVIHVASKTELERLAYGQINR